MKYFGEPYSHIIDYDRGKEVFCFDENGEHETNDLKLIDWMKKNKNFIWCAETKKTAKSDKIQCNICSTEFDNKGKLLAHMKKHKKEG